MSTVANRFNPTLLNRSIVFDPARYAGPALFKLLCVRPHSSDYIFIRVGCWALPIT